MINKIVQTMADAMQGVKDGMTVLLGGFGLVGQPNHLVDALIERGVKDLTVVANNAGGGTTGLTALMEHGQVRRLVCSFPRSNSTIFEELYRAGKIELEIVPQGTMAERIRAAGAGVGAFFTPTGVGTKMAEGKEVREINGRMMVLEHALRGDIALVEAWEADRWGNLTFKLSGRNFNPVMATAADITIVQSQHIVELGAIDPQNVMCPGIFVDRVIHIPYGDPPF